MSAIDTYFTTNPFAPDAHEPIGLRHDVHAWFELANEVSTSFAGLFVIFEQTGQDHGLMPSADLLGKHGTQRAMAARRYLQATAKQSSFLDKLLERQAPEVWGRLRRVAKAGRWFQDTEDSCFLGLATIWKLQVDAHLDCNDFALCIMTCGGNFRGGRLYLPDLGLCLA